MAKNLMELHLFCLPPATVFLFLLLVLYLSSIDSFLLRALLIRFFYAQLPRLTDYARTFIPMKRKLIPLLPVC